MYFFNNAWGTLTDFGHPAYTLWFTTYSHRHLKYLAFLPFDYLSISFSGEVFYNIRNYIKHWESIMQFLIDYKNV